MVEPQNKLNFITLSNLEDHQESATSTFLGYLQNEEDEEVSAIES